MKRKILILFFSICIIVAILFIVFNFCNKKNDYEDYVKKYSATYNLEESLVYSIIKVESDFDANAVSGSGALGLMQIIPRTAKWIATEFNEIYEKQNMFNPETNVKYGCFYLNYLFDKFKYIDVVICAYNAGEGVVRDWLDESGNLVEEKISYDETKNYLKKVKKFYSDYKNQT